MGKKYTNRSHNGVHMVYDASCSAQMACKPVLTSSTMQATDTKQFYCSNVYTVAELETKPFIKGP